MTKLTMSERRDRKAHIKAALAEIKSAARQHGWRFARETLFAERDGWFVSVHIDMSPWSHTTRLTLRAKPMALDPLFWEIAGIADNATQPLSFRAFGMGVCTTPPAAEINLANDTAQAILEWAAQHARAPGFPGTPDAFVERLSTAGDGYFESHVTQLCLMDRLQDASALCDAAKARGFPGTFVRMTSTGDIGFADMTLAWLKRRTGQAQTKNPR